MKSGIYKITNIINDKIYIGSAVNLEKRKLNHFSDLKSNKHKNIHLQRAYNLQKEEGFCFEILEFVKDKNRLVERENYYFVLLKPEYNICKIANSSLGVIRREETKEKIRQANIGKKLTNEHKEKIRQGNLGKKRTDEQRKKYSESKMGFKNPVFTHGWEKSVAAMTKANLGCKRSKETGIKIGKKLSKPIVQIDLKGKKIKEWSSANEVERVFGWANSHINKVCNGKNKTAYGFFWKFKK